MTSKEIKENLCYYDKRNPDGYFDPLLENDEEDFVKPDPCYCDNCFYGRTELAEELLKQIKINVDLLKNGLKPHE